MKKYIKELIRIQNDAYIAGDILAEDPRLGSEDTRAGIERTLRLCGLFLDACCRNLWPFRKDIESFVARHPAVD